MEAREQGALSVSDEVIWRKHMRGKSVSQIAAETGASRACILDAITSGLERQSMSFPRKGRSDDATR